MAAARTALFGHTGFVGSNLKQQTSFTHLYNSKNIEEARGQSFDLVVFSACPAAKWLANKEPEKDAATIASLMGILRTIQTKFLILISTIDVYARPAQGGDESYDCMQDEQSHHTYGLNRLKFERFVQEQFAGKYLIARLPALYGFALKKNYIYDIIHDNNTHLIRADSNFQWYDLAELWAHLESSRSQGLTLVNLFPEPISTADLIATMKRELPECAAAIAKIPPPPAEAPTSGPSYRVQTNLAAGAITPSDSAPGYLYSGARSLRRFELYLRREVLRSRLVVSNIAWDSQDDASVFQALSTFGVKKVEVGPTKIWGNWDRISTVTADEARAYAAKLLADHGITIPSMQAVLFAKPDLVILRDEATRQRTLDHLEMVGNIASWLANPNPSSGSDRVLPAIVFGAPKNRQLGELDTMTAWPIARSFFEKLAAVGERTGSIFCIEANPPLYACDFLFKAADAARMVRDVNSPFLRLHLDSACMHLANDDSTKSIANNVDILCHYHASEPNLGNFAAPQVNHAKVGSALHAAGYKGCVSIEMAAAGGQTPEQRTAAVVTAIQHVLEAYVQ